MKKLIISLIVIALIFSFSCRDTKKEEVEVKAIIEQVEAVENDINAINEDINSKEKELEEALRALDSL